MSFVQIRNLWSEIDAPVDGAAKAFNAVLSLLFEQKMQSYLHENCFGLSSAPSFVQDHLFTNIRGYPHAVVDEGGCNRMEGTDLQDNMRLNFIGAATAAPKPGALKLCSVFGQELYVDGHGCSTFASERFVHAWTLPVYDATQHANNTPKI